LTHEARTAKCQVLARRDVLLRDELFPWDGSCGKRGGERVNRPFLEELGNAVRIVAFHEGGEVQAEQLKHRHVAER